MDDAGQAYVTGTTSSTDFPTQNPLQSANGGATDVFVAQLTADGTALKFSTYLGGSGGEQGDGIAMNSAGQACVTGLTDSRDFPTQNPVQSANGGGGDAFVAKLKVDGSALVL